MRLRAQITVDISADDFVQAADHQTRLATFVHKLKCDYPDAQLVIRERRERRPDILPDATLTNRIEFGARRNKLA